MTRLTIARRRDIQTKADAVAGRYPTALGTSTRLLAVCRDEGIEVREADLGDIAGALRREGGNWRAYLGRQDAPGRRAFTLARLLGHFVLHAGPGRAFAVGPFVRHLDGPTGREAAEAAEFAAGLVMPAAAIEQALAGTPPTEARVCTLAGRFGVSPLAVAVRLRGLGYAVPAPSTRPRRPAGAASPHRPSAGSPFRTREEIILPV